MLHHDCYTAEAANPKRWLLMLHGILGTGANWRTFARRLCSARPEWGVVTADLRMHGDSQDEPSPHNLDACVDDLVALSSHLRERLGDRGFAAVAGHSFGSKVALLFAARRNAERAPLESLWILDAEVGSRIDRMTAGDDTVQKILGYLEALPPSFARKSDFVASLVARGLTTGVAEWLAMNLERVDASLRLRTDVTAIRELLGDYLQRDAYDDLRSVAQQTEVHVVLGGASDTVSDAGRDSYEALAGAGELALTTLPGAGHWVHVDAFKELLELVTQELP